MSRYNSYFTENTGAFNRLMHPGIQVHRDGYCMGARCSFYGNTSNVGHSQEQPLIQRGYESFGRDWQSETIDQHQTDNFIDPLFSDKVEGLTLKQKEGRHDGFLGWEHSRRGHPRIYSQYTPLTETSQLHLIHRANTLPQDRHEVVGGFHTRMFQAQKMHDHYRKTKTPWSYGSYGIY